MKENKPFKLSSSNFQLKQREKYFVPVFCVQISAKTCVTQKAFINKFVANKQSQQKVKVEISRWKFAKC